VSVALRPWRGLLSGDESERIVDGVVVVLGALLLGVVVLSVGGGEPLGGVLAVAMPCK
jgi:hypothetical protein